jgi:hypothetical protein
MNPEGGPPRRAASLPSLPPGRSQRLGLNDYSAVATRRHESVGVPTVTVGHEFRETRESGNSRRCDIRGPAGSSTTLPCSQMEGLFRGRTADRGGVRCQLVYNTVHKETRHFGARGEGVAVEGTYSASIPSSHSPKTPTGSDLLEDRASYPIVWKTQRVWLRLGAFNFQCKAVGISRSEGGHLSADGHWALGVSSISSNVTPVSATRARSTAPRLSGRSRSAFARG